MASGSDDERSGASAPRRGTAGTAGGAGLAPVVVTRAEGADGPLTSQLRSLGLKVLLWPAIEVTPSDSSEFDAALARIAEFDWIVFASRQAVPPVLERVGSQPGGLHVAAVGQATAQVLRQRGWRVDLVPDEPNAGALVAAFTPIMKPDLRVLFPASSRALPTIAKGLAQLGAQVKQVEAYRTEAAALDLNECRDWIGRGEIGAVTFASPSAVIELERALGKDDFDKLLKSAAAVAIGPTTARVLTELGCIPVMAESATLRGLANTTFRLVQTRH
ncbi:MAG: uroporphyrinogen-III synthase [Gammaproteobacteria bacterium]